MANEQKRNRKHLPALFIAVIAIFAVILYLPVFIWSPPWGQYGIYAGTVELFADHIHHEYLVHTERISIHFISHKNKPIKQRIIARKHPTLTDHSYRSQHITFEHNKAILAHYTLSYPILPPKVLHKSSNPITVWYVKWLQWVE